MYWFIAMHLLTATKKSISAAELQRHLGHKRYQPIWEMMHKLRSVMGKRDDKYTLRGNIELDEDFFSTETPDTQKQEKLKAGAGSQKKSKVLVIAESTESVKLLYFMNSIVDNIVRNARLLIKIRILSQLRKLIRICIMPLICVLQIED